MLLTICLPLPFAHSLTLSLLSLPPPVPFSPLSHCAFSFPKCLLFSCCSQQLHNPASLYLFDFAVGRMTESVTPFCHIFTQDSLLTELAVRCRFIQSATSKQFFWKLSTLWDFSDSGLNNMYKNVLLHIEIAICLI